MKCKRIWINGFVSCGGLGFSPFASGTVASFVAVVFWVGLAALGVGLEWRALMAVVLMVTGSLATIAYETDKPEKDLSEVVIDEWVGMGIALWTCDLKPLHIAIAFFLFRLFDIWKPKGVRYFDQNYLNGWGVMMDDVIAGVYAAICLRIFEIFI